jgi:hypothetical protein
MPEEGRVLCRQHFRSKVAGGGSASAVQGIVCVAQSARCAGDAAQNGKEKA